MSYLRIRLLALVTVALIMLLFTAYFFFNESMKDVVVSDDAVDKQDPRSPSVTHQPEAITSQPSKAANVAPGGSTSVLQTVSIEYCSRHATSACSKAYQDAGFATQVIAKQLKENPRARRYMRAIQMHLQPFNFNGQVLDAAGSPLDKVEVAYQMGYPFSLGYSDQQTVTTDVEGRFVVSGQAYSLKFRSLKKDGFVPAPGFSTTPKFGWETRAGIVSWAQITSQTPQVFIMMPGQLP